MNYFDRWARLGNRLGVDLRLMMRFTLTAFAIIQTASFAYGQFDDETMQLTLHPQPAPQSMFRYRLLPSIGEQTPGNAAVIYGKVMAEQHGVFGYKDYWEDQQKYLEMPLEELRESDLVRGLTRHGMIFDSLDAASKCEHCDWQVPVRGGDFANILLPEVQELSMLSRLLRLRARYQIACGDHEESLRTIASTVAMARHVSNASTDYHAIVGSYIVSNASQVLLEYAQQPDAPNLYWALSTLPDPLIDCHAAYRSVLESLPLTFEFFAHVDSDHFNDQYWDEQMRLVWKMIKKPPRESVEPLERLELVMMRVYPIAKSLLVESGINEEQVNEMPVSHVVLAASAREYQRELEAAYQLTFLPFPESVKKLRQAKAERKSLPRLLPLTRVLDFHKQLEAVAVASIRTRTQIALLRTIEAVRLHAAENGNQLPQQLAEITEVPLPIDPSTQKPFDYRVEGDLAIITHTALPNIPNRFEIKIAKQGAVR